MYGDSPHAPIEIVILLTTERDYDLDHCVQIAEHALGLDAMGVITPNGDFAPSDVGASVYLVDRDGETLFYFCAPEQVPVVVRTGMGRFPGTEGIRDQRSWVHLALETRAHTDVPPEHCMLLDRLTAGFMEDGVVQIYLPQQGLFVPASESLRSALYARPFAEALETAKILATPPPGASGPAGSPASG